MKYLEIHGNMLLNDAMKLSMTETSGKVVETVYVRYTSWFCMNSYCNNRESYVSKRN
jgi:hypothetical protein